MNADRCPVRLRGCHRESAHLLSPRPAPFHRLPPFSNLSRESPSYPSRPISSYFRGKVILFHWPYETLIKNDIFIRLQCGNIFRDCICTIRLFIRSERSDRFAIGAMIVKNIGHSEKYFFKYFFFIAVGIFNFIFRNYAAVVRLEEASSNC